MLLLFFFFSSSLFFIFVLIGISCLISNQVELFSSTCLEADLNKDKTLHLFLYSFLPLCDHQLKTVTRTANCEVTKETHHDPHLTGRGINKEGFIHVAEYSTSLSHGLRDIL